MLCAGVVVVLVLVGNTSRRQCVVGGEGVCVVMWVVMSTGGQQQQQQPFVCHMPGRVCFIILSSHTHCIIGGSRSYTTHSPKEH